ncbi:MAG: hypothetical protein Q9226_006292 [Calogaya cf. arnoldii]
MPKAGNPNCFVSPINEGAKPLGRDILPDGSKLEIPDKCPTALSRRINSDLACGIGLSVGVATGCTAICLSIGFFTFGAAYLTCLSCPAVTYLAVINGCKFGNHDKKLKPRLLLDARAHAIAQADPTREQMCTLFHDMGLCPVTANKLVQFHKCEEIAGGLPGEGEDVQATGLVGGMILT